MKKYFMLLFVVFLLFGCDLASSGGSGASPDDDEGDEIEDEIEDEEEIVSGEGDKFAGTNFIEFGAYGGDYPNDSYETFKIEFKEDGNFDFYGNGRFQATYKSESESTENVTYKYKLNGTVLTYTKSYDSLGNEVIQKFIFTKVDDNHIKVEYLHTSAEDTKDAYGPVKITLE